MCFFYVHKFAIEGIKIIKFMKLYSGNICQFCLWNTTGGLVHMHFSHGIYTGFGC